MAQRASTTLGGPDSRRRLLLAALLAPELHVSLTDLLKNTHDIAELAVGLLDLPVVVLLLLLQARDVLAERGLERLVSAVDRRARLLDEPAVSCWPHHQSSSRRPQKQSERALSNSRASDAWANSHLADSAVQLALSLRHRREFPHGELEDLLLLLLLLDLSADDRRLALAVDGLRLDLLQDLGTVS